MVFSFHQNSVCPGMSAEVEHSLSLTIRKVLSAIFCIEHNDALIESTLLQNRSSSWSLCYHSGPGTGKAFSMLGVLMSSLVKA